MESIAGCTPENLDRCVRSASNRSVKREKQEGPASCGAFISYRKMSINSNIKILQTLTGHRNDVTSCDFGKNFTLITGSSDKTVRIWDWSAGSGYKQRANSPIRDHKYQITCIRISPQNSMFASASVDGTAILYNFYSLKKLFTMVQVNGDAIRVCRFAPDSSIIVTAGDNGAICIWDLIHKSLIRIISEHEGATQSLAFTADSQYLISACSLEVIRVWYVQDLVDTTTIMNDEVEQTCSSLAKLDNAHDLGVFCVDIKTSIKVDENNPLIKYYTLATSGNSNDIKIWTITSISTLKSKCTSSNEVSIEYCDTYDGHCSSVTCIRYNSNGEYLISSSLDKTIKIWDNDGNCVATLEGHIRYVNCVAITKDSSLIATGSTGSNDKLLIIWDLTNKITIDTELFYSNHHLTNNSNFNIHEMVLVQQDNEDNVKLLEKIDDISEGGINCCCFNQSGILATGSSDKLIRLLKIVEENNNLEETNASPLDGHTYAVNHVEFSKDGTKLASCSLDGHTFIWDSLTGEKLGSLPINSLSVKTCRFSFDDSRLITAGDDEKATVWDCSTLNELACLEGHLDAVTSACFTPDDKVIATTSTHGDFLLWKVEDFTKIYLKDDVHDGGIQYGDFSPNLEPIPNTFIDIQAYLLGTCGNDSFVKLWKILVPKSGNYEEIEVRLWRLLRGHGGNVVSLRFSPNIGEIVCSTATDRQARLWSVYSSECLHVLEHDSIVTSCAFTFNCALLAIGCLDKTLWLWRLPQQLIFQTAVANKIKCRSKALIDWTVSDVVEWLISKQLDDIVQNAKNASLDGQKLLTLSETQICSGLDLSDEQSERLQNELRWLKQSEYVTTTNPTLNNEIPHDFLCPITHEIMREPVKCSDGYTYEKIAIAEWFMSGKYTSPLTNETLETTEFTYNHELRNAIHSFLDQIEN